MSVSLTHLSWWLWSGKHQEPKRLSNGSSLNSFQHSGLWESDALKFPLVKGLLRWHFNFFFLLEPLDSLNLKVSQSPEPRSTQIFDFCYCFFFCLRWMFNLGFWFCLFQLLLRSPGFRFRIYLGFDRLIVGLFGWSHGGDRRARAVVRVYAPGRGAAGRWRCGQEFEFQFFSQGFNFF